MSKNFILLSFNELNFDYLKKYSKIKKYKNFNKIINKIKETLCGEEYKYLEPWIQWPTIYTGKTAKEHGLFRLGDCVNFENETIFNLLEAKGKTVGAISSINLKNDLKNPHFFIPDPWTDTPPDDSYWSKKISKTINYFVKNNSKLKYDFKLLLDLFLIFLKYARIVNYPIYIKLFLTSFGKNWRKALFLDLLLNDIYLYNYKKFKTNFSNLFLNGLAHIQHHYFLNSEKIDDNKLQNPNWYLTKKYDPLSEAFYVYDKILGDYLNLKDCNFMLATGLSQTPYDRVKYYYKLINHELFFDKFGLKYQNIFELMSRDFIIRFQNTTDCTRAFNIVANISDNNKKKLFGDIQVKKNDLFVSFVYDEEIKDQRVYSSSEDEELNLKNFVNFVALKNGMHNQKGFVYFEDFKDDTKIRIENIKSEILKNI